MKTIAEKIGAFEAAHAVEEYRACGLQAWPFLRNRLELQVAFSTSEGETADLSPTVSPLKRRLSALRSVVSTKAPNPAAPRSPAASPDMMRAVLLTDSSRVVRQAGTDYHYLGDPVIERLESERVCAAPWDIGQPGPRPRHHSPLYVREALDNAIRRQLLLAKFTRRFKQWENPPDWFAEFGPWAESILKRKVAWRDCFQSLRYGAMAEAIFRKWLSAAAPEMLIVDCWYGANAMAAIAAAARLRISTCDLQHGLQGIANSAYACWNKIPPEGFAACPDFFWCWGRHDAELLTELNAEAFAKDRAFVCGNLWLNQWRDSPARHQESHSAARRLTAGHSKALLVTLQRGLEDLDQLIAIIAQSPPDWLWLIRLHRQQTAELPEIERRLQAIDHFHINVREATEQPLYALLSASQVHLTWFSTCALEALAFGVPSVLLSQTGARAYEQQLKEGLMRFAEKPAEALAAITDAAGASPEACQAGAGRVFASEEESAAGIRRLLERCREFRKIGV